MNKYVVRTSVVWLAILGISAAIYVWRFNLAGKQNPTPSGVQPVAVGPPVVSPPAAVVAHAAAGSHPARAGTPPEHRSANRARTT